MTGHVLVDVTRAGIVAVLYDGREGVRLIVVED